MPSYWLRCGWLTFCPGRPWTAILLIIAFWVARITGVSHWHPVHIPFSNRLSYITMLSIYYIINILIALRVLSDRSHCMYSHHTCTQIKATAACSPPPALTLMQGMEPRASNVGQVLHHWNTSPVLGFLFPFLFFHFLFCNKKCTVCN
jgi:hypothetical protein